MAEKGIPYVDDIKLHLIDDVSFAVIEFIAGNDASSFAITQDMQMKLVGRLEDLGAEWTKRREQIDPFAGKAGDVTAMTAIRPHSVNTATIPNSDESAIIFETAHGPKAFAMPKAAMVALAQKLLREAERYAQKPPLSS